MHEDDAIPLSSGLHFPIHHPHTFYTNLACIPEGFWKEEEIFMNDISVTNLRFRDNSHWFRRQRSHEGLV